MGDFWSSRIFFSSNLVGRIFFPFFSHKRETSHRDKGDDHVHVEKAVLSPVGDVKTGLSVYFIRLAIWQVKKSFSIYRLQVMGLQINLSGECDA